MIGLALAVIALDTPKPILAINLDRSIISPSPESWRETTRWVKVPGGNGVEMMGNSSGWMMVDHPALALEKQFTVCAWLKPAGYVLAGPQAQIMFRGDDRPGLDPYSFAIHDNGTIFLRINDPDNRSEDVTSATKLPINTWTHVLASFDAGKQIMKIFINGELSGTTKTILRPLGRLEAIDSAGIGIGNVQWDKGPHNQPYHGTLADLRLYNVALEPKDIGFNPKGWGIANKG